MNKQINDWVLVNSIGKVGKVSDGCIRDLSSISVYTKN